MYYEEAETVAVGIYRRLPKIDSGGSRIQDFADNSKK